MGVDEALRGRHSSRSFRPDPIPEETLREILEVASYAPSGANMQPWLVWVVSGDRLAQISREILDHIHHGGGHLSDYDYYPSEWFSPYKQRRIATGVGLYEILGIERSDRKARDAQWHKNYLWFGAPVVLFVMVDKRLMPGSFLDLGAFMQSVCLAAHARGIGSCIQASTAEYGQIVRRVLGVDEGKVMAYSIVLGYADEAPENSYRPARVSIDEFATFIS